LICCLCEQKFPHQSQMWSAI